MAGGLLLSLGGNALIPPDEEGDIKQQVSRAREVFRTLLPLIVRHERCLLVHGNGPQVGHELLRSEVAEKEGDLFHLPLDVLVADCQGAMGYVLQRELGSLLRQAGDERPVVTLVTQVRVDPADPAFGSPTKPVGRFHDAVEVEELRNRFGWDMVEDAGRGWRRVLPSPRPLSVIESAAIEALWEAGALVIAGGGGGIPVIGQGPALDGAEAVIDKDLTTALLARALEPELVVMVTGVDAVQRSFGTPEAEVLTDVTTAQLRGLAAAGEFAPGSMGPKIEALIDLVEAVEGCEALVSSPESLSEALVGRAGTRIRSVGGGGEQRGQGGGRMAMFGSSQERTRMEPNDVKQVLAASPTFVGFNEAEIGVIAEAGEVKEVASGENLIEEGGAGHSAYLVLSGDGDVYKKGPETGKQHHLARVEAGQILGEIGLLLEHSRSATITAGDEFVVFELTQDAFNSLLDANDSAARKLLTTIARHVARRSREVNERLVGFLEHPEEHVDKPTRVDLSGLKDRYRRGLSYV